LKLLTIDNTSATATATSPPNTPAWVDQQHHLLRPKHIYASRWCPLAR
jgi:hypothetical protein